MRILSSLCLSLAVLVTANAVRAQDAPSTNTPAQTASDTPSHTAADAPPDIGADARSDTAADAPSAAPAVPDVVADESPPAVPNPEPAVASRPDESVSAPQLDVGNRIGLATHQLETREYGDAEQVLSGVIAEIEQQTSRYDAALVRPLILLGDALSGQAKYKPALQAYEQADHITRITEGLHSVEQVDIVYREANALASLGNIEKANDRQEYAYETLERKYGPLAPELVPGLYHLAGWYERTSNIFAARGLYERAYEILARTYGDTDSRLIPALRGLASTYREERFPPYHVPELEDPSGALHPGNAPAYSEAGFLINRFGPGEQALAQIVKITGADPNAKPIDLPLAEIALGDWYVLFDKQSRAVPVYVHARQLLKERAGLTDEQIAAYFGAPVALYLPMPPNPPAPPEALRANPASGYVEVGYTVTETGAVGDLKTLGSDPPGLMDTKVRRGLRVARFRPRFDGDAPVASPDQVYRHSFVYYPRTPPATTDRPAGATKSPPTAG